MALMLMHKCLVMNLTKIGTSHVPGTDAYICCKIKESGVILHAHHHSIVKHAKVPFQPHLLVSQQLCPWCTLQATRCRTICYILMTGQMMGIVLVREVFLLDVLFNTAGMLFTTLDHTDHHVATMGKDTHANLLQTQKCGQDPMTQHALI